ncbi:MAG: aminoacyl-histidine dipeptidase [Bacteroidales bacterium]|nr:aminoacyl-histidine dipeptidase [Candidatus Colimorpha pelethequi]MCQ2262234.1 aminoacyl-histidine dipeptidase [Bacteroidales bacterium]
MQNVFENLKPANVWRYFDEIMQIPRPSKHEEKVSAYLQKFGKDLGLETLSDSLGNVLIRKPASKGYEKSAGVCLQAHMDMVCEKNGDKVFDFLKDGIQPILDGEWLTADGTTLGADDGIGVAAILAILADNSLEHGPLEALFTVDEETGLTGANGLATDWLKSEILLNFDDEDEGEYCIGCAGGIDTTVAIDYTTRPVPAGEKSYRVRVYGLKGGHSGDDINKGLGCANKMLTRILWNGTQDCKIGMARIDGGNLRNAIAREAWADIVVAEEYDARFCAMVKDFAEKIKFEFRSTEPGLQIELQPIDQPECLIDRQTQYNLLDALYACAHGVLAMSREIPNFVETSTNLASVKMDGKQIHIATSQRSSVESAKYAAAQKIEATFRMIGAHVSHGDGYPGWTPNPNSRVLKVGVDVYKKLYGKDPVVRAIHAGLECGLIGEKYPKMDMISYGPTLRGVHSPDERIEIKTVEMFWNQTLAILKALK